MPQVNDTTASQSCCQATVMEAELDSICLTLGQMKSKLQKREILDHMTAAERSELEAALARAEGRLNELGAVIRGDA